MTHFDREAFFVLDKAWKESADLPAKILFETTVERTKRVKTSVTPDNGKQGIEFFLGVTLSKFKDAKKEMNWDGPESLAAFRKCLQGSMKLSSDEVIQDKFSNEADKTVANFPKAIEALIKNVLNCKKA